MGYLSQLVKVPDVPGKIVLRKRQDRVYVLYEVGRRYKAGKRSTVPERVMIGQQIRTKPEWMLPNENYERYFSEEMMKMTEEEREAAAEYIAARGEFRTLQIVFDQLYYEFQVQARRDPHEIVNEYKVEKINRVLDRLMELMEGKNYAVFLERVPTPQTESGEDGKERLSGLNYGDVSLLLTQFKGAVTRYSGEII